MISWSLKRRITYIVTLLGLFAFLAGWFLFVASYEPATCYDGKQNGLEPGVDCGGECAFLCPFQVSEPVVVFSRTFNVSGDVYNSIAYVENPNFNIGNRSIEYTFKLYDAQNELIVERNGRTFIGVGQITPIFEGPIVIEDDREPVRTIFELKENNRWEHMRSRDSSPLVVRNKVLENPDTQPRVSAVLENTSVAEYRDIEVVTVVFNALENAIATSRTFVDRLPSKSSSPLVFTWPQPFASELEECVVPVDVALLFDVSGSMNDDSEDPPQPLTDAKEAAAEFAERLSERDRLGLVTFATQSKILKPFSNQHEGNASLIRNISINPEEEAGSTNMGAAFANAVGLVVSDTSKARSDIEKIAILLTDGIANEPEDPGGEPYALEQARLAKERGYIVYTIGLGSNVNEGFLRQLATAQSGLDDQYYYDAATSKDLLGIYENISDSICERGAAIIDIIPRLR